MGNRGFGSGIFRPFLMVVSICLLMFLLYAYSSTNSELKQHKDRGDRLAKQQEMLKTQIKGVFVLFIILLNIKQIVVLRLAYVFYLLCCIPLRYNSIRSR